MITHLICLHFCLIVVFQKEGNQESKLLVEYFPIVLIKKQALLVQWKMKKEGELVHIQLGNMHPAIQGNRARVKMIEIIEQGGKENVKLQMHMMMSNCLLLIQK